jgi:hypothetical protein
MRQYRPTFQAIDPGIQRRTSVADVAAKPDVRDPPAAGLRIDPCRAHPQQLGDLLCGKQIVIAQGQVSPGIMIW